MSKFLMQARDSVTGAMFRWLANAPAFDGTGYSGPNSPEEIAVVGSTGDASSLGLSPRSAVRVSAPGPIFTLAGAHIIDDVELVDGDRVLLTEQTNPVENGVWIALTAGWERPDDFANGDHAAAAFFFVEEGTESGDTGWVCSSDGGADVVGTDDLSFVQFSALPEVTAGPGLYKSGISIGLLANPEFSAGALRAYVAPNVVTGTTLSNGANSDSVIDLTTPGNGYFQFHVQVLFKRQFGSYRRVSLLVDALRVGGVLTIQGTQINLPAGNGLGLTVTLAPGAGGDAGNLVVNVANGTGENGTGRIYVGWTWEALIS